MFGKWHLGTNGPYHPAQRGFDEALVSNGRHFKIRTNPARDVDPTVYLADYLTDQAVGFIERHAEERFFLYVPHFAVHTPIQAKEDLIARYRAKEPVGGHNNPVYAAMIHSVDESVGRIVAALDDAGISDKTLVIFMSDNGGLGGYQIPGTDRTKGITDNAPLRGGKGTLYEGGTRVPFIATWPAAIPAGTKAESPAVHVDLFPTLVELAGGTPNDEYPLDGESLVRLLKEPNASFAHGPIYYHFPGYLESYIPEATWRTTPVSTIRVGDYKLLEFLEDDRIELYNIRTDISESQDLADSMPDKVAELHRTLKAWRESTGARMPSFKED
jgi:arylsulfatase A-like enzyme